VERENPAFSPDGEMLATGGKTINIYNATNDFSLMHTW